MPIGILRLNARHQRPNPIVSFIKPLPGPTATVAEDFLSRVAAISVPIMRAHHLAITTLEEYEPNREFIGRNFNNGEIVQLVLRTRGGGWMSFRSVVLVLMHELAHNGQMNHGREFWKLNDRYKEEMRELWAKGYHGEGVWGRGWELDTGNLGFQGVTAEDMPANLCGGTYRSRRKRKEPQRLSYKEQKEKRILRKFGAGGMQLGGDDQARTILENKSVKGNPRVAKSARGRELRAAAALKRYQEPAEADSVKYEAEEGSDQESEFEDDNKGELALDTHGNAIRDGKGNAMIKVEDEDAAGVYIKNEMQELQDLNAVPTTSRSQGMDDVKLSNQRCKPTVSIREEPLSQPRDSQVWKEPSSPSPPVLQSLQSLPPEKPKKPSPPPPTPAKSIHQVNKSTTASSTTTTAAFTTSSSTTTTTCPICSLQNDPSALLCSTCAHVLDARKSPAAWRCGSADCRRMGYLNSADYGLCGICGK